MIARMNNAAEVIAWTADAVRIAIERSGRTKRFVSDETGIAYPTLNRKVAGHSEFSLTELLAIADALHISPVAFVPPAFQSAPHASGRQSALSA